MRQPPTVPSKFTVFSEFTRMLGSLPSGWMRRVLLFLVLVTGVLLIAMYAHGPPLVSLQPFAPRRYARKLLSPPMKLDPDKCSPIYRTATDPPANRFNPRELPRGLITALLDKYNNDRSDVQLFDYLEDFRTFHSPWSWICVGGRCERRAVRSSRTSLETCNALCGGNTRLLWPRPTGNIFLGTENAMLRIRQIEFVTVDTSERDVKNLIEQAKDVFIGNVKSLIKVPNAKGRSNIDNFVIYLSAGNARGTRLTLDTDESYELDVSSKGKQLEARITGKSFYGVRHGLETLSQLIWWDEIAGRQGVLRVLSNVRIEDKPTFRYRGLMIDTSRQFFSIERLKRALDGMAASKLNTFHWHLTDSQSFPFESAIYPQMARWGAYSGDEIYTPEDVKDLVDYARIRGIRIIAEIDAPAHASAGWQWGKFRTFNGTPRAEHGYGELALCVDQEPWSVYCGEPNCGQLNPLNEHSYKILEGLYGELLELTEVRDIIHLGGDEVNLDCWAQYNNITAFMQAQNITDLHSLWADFESKILRKVIKANHDEIPKAVVLWSSPLTKRPWITSHFDPKLHVIQSWGGSNWPETGDLLEDGFRVILSHVDAWYLDCGFGRWRETGEAACGEYRTWQTVYNHRPWRDYQSVLNLVLGGEAAIWSEQTGQASLGPRLWPRASALAERLWSDLPTNSYSTEETVYTRLASHIELLQSRGLKTEAMWPRWCSLNPGSNGWAQ